MSSYDEKRYWKTLEERDRDPEFLAAAQDEFAEAPERVRPSRRGFLKAAGFSAAGALLAGCSRAPVEKAIPYLIKPEEITPGRAYYYSSTCAGCSAGCGLIVKNRDGRPIKLEGNPAHPMSHGGLCAVGQASILGLYDSLRLQDPLIEGKKASWAEVDRQIAAQLGDIRSRGGAVRFLSNSITSPTLRASIEQFLGTFRDARHVIYDPLSSSAILDAHLRTHGVRALPRYRFEQAEVIASLDADFLGTWISPVEFTDGYRKRRSLEGTSPQLSYHVQFESRMSITGSKADLRIAIAPEEQGLLLTHLTAKLAGNAGDGGPVVDELAKRLLNARGRSLVLSGSQDVAVQTLCNFANHLLGNYGATVDLARPSYQRQGNDADLAALLDELQQKRVAALLIAGVNPLYDLPGAGALERALRAVPLVVSFADHTDETAAAARFVCPDRHTLESWADAEAVSGVVSLTQPVIHALANTRPLLESLAMWSGEGGQDGRAPRAYEMLRASWEKNIFPRQSKETSFQAFWDGSLEQGYAEVEPRPITAKPFDVSQLQPVRAAAGAGGLSLVLYPKAGMLDGRHAENAWLQELPDPISKVAWDNYACLSPKTAARLGVVEGDVVRVTAAGNGDAALELPVFLQPGQHDAVIAVALGYGRKATARFSGIGPRWLEARPSVGDDGRVGKNAAPLLSLAGGALQYTRGGITLTKTGRKYELASTQGHQTIAVPKNLAPAGAEPRPIIQETTLAAFLKDAAAGSHPQEQHEDLWPEDHPYYGHRWGMVIDLNACTGCSACVVACQVENNIPVVGKDEVRRRRIMHWLRVDRYYSDMPGPRKENEVEVAYQPMFCQQCDNAPCETVCPVLATVHSAEGLNQQIYNRCVGTRYCANNCPYKVRRFNWFAYAHEDRLQNLVLNPGVTVRSRGVMEKCSFCVQRIQEAKIEAKRKGEPLADGAIQPACQQSCPAHAIVFGDLNDPKSRAAQMMKNPRRYKVLEELNIRPAVGYLRLVRNRPEPDGERNG